MPQQVRKPTDRDRFRPLSGQDGFVALVAIALGVVVPLLNAVTVVSVVVAFLAALLVGVGLLYLPRRVRGLAGAVAFAVGLAVCVLVATPLGLTWLSSLALGVGLGSHLRHRSQQDETPPSVADHGSRAIWDEGTETVETTDPSTSQVVDAVRRLDGDQRSFVSILHASARLDVAGDAGGAMMVYQSDDRTDHRSNWHHLTTPDPGTDDEVVVTVAGWPGHFRRSQTTTIEPALSAAEHYLTTGHRAPALPWHGDRDVSEMRPPGLQAID